jgi:hypothetical protein
VCEHGAGATIGSQVSVEFDRDVGHVDIMFGEAVL